MEKVPPEILDTILAHLIVRQRSLTERDALITPESRKDVPNARLVCRGFCYSKSLKDDFVQVLEETFLLFEDYNFQRLFEVAYSEYAAKMTSLTFSTQNTRINESMPSEVGDLYGHYIKRFWNVNKIRFSTPDEKQYEAGRTKERQKVISWTVASFGRAGIHIRDIDMSFRIVKLKPWLTDSSDLAVYPSPPCGESLRRIAVSEIHDPSLNKAVLRRHIVKLQNLEVFELVLHTINDQHAMGSSRKQRLVSRRIGIGLTNPLSSLKVFHFSSIHSARIESSEILRAVELFPNLETLGLAYVVLVNKLLHGDGEWTRLLRRLQAFRLKSIKLLFPAYHRPQNGGLPYAPRDFEGECETINTVLGHKTANTELGYKMVDTVLGCCVQIRRFANGLDVIPFSDEVWWRIHDPSSDGGKKVLGFNIFDV